MKAVRKQGVATNYRALLVLAFLAWLLSRVLNAPVVDYEFAARRAPRAGASDRSP